MTQPQGPQGQPWGMYPSGQPTDQPYRTQPVDIRWPVSPQWPTDAEMDFRPYPYPGPYPVEPQQPRRSVTRTRKPTNHTFHLVMTLCTFGAWGFVWLTIALWHRYGPRRRSVTRYR